MLDVIIDTVVDILKLLPFLFVAFFLLECIEHRWQKLGQDILQKAGKFGPLLGGLLGLIPQCGFGVIATHFFITRFISLGTLISIYLTTSDEMLPVLLAGGCSVSKILVILGIKLVIGVSCGYMVDLLIPRKKEICFGELCDSVHCDCSHGVIKSSVKHTLKTTVYIFFITFVLNIVMFYVDVSNLSFLTSNRWFSPILFALFGLIPNCGASIAISQLYLKNIISFGSCIAGLLTNSGVAILVLFKVNKNKRENVLVLVILLGIAVFFGILLSLLF